MFRIEFNALLCVSYHTIWTVLVSFIALFKTFDPIAIIPDRLSVLSGHIVDAVASVLYLSLFIHAQLHPQDVKKGDLINKMKYEFSFPRCNKKVR
jgi:hypothetical protein